MVALRAALSVVRPRPDLPPDPGGSGPVRTCIGCRRRAESTALFRVVAMPPAGPENLVRLEVDIRRRLPGRGAWVHPEPRCVEQAIRRRAFARALRVTGAVDTGAVELHVSSTVREQVHER